MGRFAQGPVSRAPRIARAQHIGFRGDATVDTTMICTHVVKARRNPARSPADLLQERTGK